MRIVLFTHHNPCPPRSGAQQRIFELLIALRELEIEVHLAGSAVLSHNLWTVESRAELQSKGLCKSIYVFNEPRQAWIMNILSRTARRVKGAVFKQTHEHTRRVLDCTTPPLRRWFADVVRKTQPESVLIHYVWFSPLISNHKSRFSGVRTILESQDLVTLNLAMNAMLDPFIRTGPVFQPYSVPEEALDLRFYERREATAHPLEFEAIDRFDVTLAISEEEAAAMRERTRHTEVFAVSTPMAPRELHTGHGELALFPMGPHPFNLQGYAWFLRKVLPLILKKCPDFQLGVSGLLYWDLTLEYHPQVRLLGFVANQSELWSMGRMLLNPNFGGTGQPIKTIEAMAAGLPPIILRRFAGTAPIEHGISGFIADDEKEFASYCIELWRDRALCSKMGRHAVDAVRTACSREKFANELGNVLLRDVTAPSHPH